MLKKRKKGHKERKQTNKQKQCRKNYKENTGTKLITNTKKQIEQSYGLCGRGRGWEDLGE